VIAEREGQCIFLPINYQKPGIGFSIPPQRGSDSLMMENKTIYYYAVEQFIMPPADAPSFYHKERFEAGRLLKSRRSAFEYFYDRLQTIERMRTLFNGQVRGPFYSEAVTKNILRIVFVECSPGGEEMEYYVMGDTREAAAEAEKQETIVFSQLGIDLRQENRKVVEKYSKVVEELVKARRGDKVDS
jgi:hypothetical protein